ncbi:MAG TPA: hypothetical protein VFS21_18265, partial [Roseiflexaceae bacterium]|nr:hypothetical protein [Roseiflexaceae bacterium]
CHGSERADGLWVSATRWGQYGPFHTRSAALGAAIRALVDRSEQQEHPERRGGRWYLLDGLSDLFLL